MSNDSSNWTYEGYWNVVLGANRSGADVVREFDLVAEGLDEWLGAAEAEACSVGRIEMPEAWGRFHQRALAVLRQALAGSASAPTSIGIIEAAQQSGADPRLLAPIAQHGRDEDGDARIRIYEIGGALVAETNGDPIWDHTCEWDALPEELRAEADRNRGV